MEPHNGVGLESIPVFKENWVAIIPKDHPLAKIKNKKISMNQIADFDLIIPSRESRLQEIGGWFAGTNKTPKVICKVAHVLSAYELTRQGIGVAIFPASSKNIINSDDVIIKEFNNPAPTVSYILVWNKHKTLSHAATEFINYTLNNTKG